MAAAQDRLRPVAKGAVSGCGDLQLTGDDAPPTAARGGGDADLSAAGEARSAPP